MRLFVILTGNLFYLDTYQLSLKTTLCFLLTMQRYDDF